MEREGWLKPSRIEASTFLEELGLTIIKSVSFDISACIHYLPRCLHLLFTRPVLTAFAKADLVKAQEKSMSQGTPARPHRSHP